MKERINQHRDLGVPDNEDLIFAKPLNEAMITHLSGDYNVAGRFATPLSPTTVCSSISVAIIRH